MSKREHLSSEEMERLRNRERANQKARRDRLREREKTAAQQAMDLPGFTPATSGAVLNINNSLINDASFNGASGNFQFDGPVRDSKANLHRIMLLGAKN